VVQRGNAVISKSSSESRIRSNLHIFDLDQTDFDAIEGITNEEGQVRFSDWDDLWGYNLFG
jgi:diketogulonate reductase-like aldo/keto reductase